jgi:hypothetical protein
MNKDIPRESPKQINEQKETFTEAFEAFLREQTSCHMEQKQSTHVSYSTAEGCITFWKEDFDADGAHSAVRSSVAIYSVAVAEQKRRTGVFSRFLKQLKQHVAQIRVLGVKTTAMRACLRKSGNFQEQKSNFVWTREIKNFTLKRKANVDEEVDVLRGKRTRVMASGSSHNVHDHNMVGDGLARETSNTMKKVSLLSSLESLLVQPFQGSMFCEYLGATDIFSLRVINHTCWQFSESLRKSKFLTKRVVKYLRQTHHLDETFCILLQTHKGVVSGSDMLRAISPSHWKSSDIDVYHARLASDTTHLAEGDPARDEHSKVGPIEQWASAQQAAHGADQGHTEMASYGHIDEIVHFSEYHLSFGSKLQVITTRDDPLIHISSGYDMDFLKVIFDGRAVTVFHMHAIRTKTSLYRPLMMYLYCQHTRYLERIYKYQQLRDYTLSNVLEVHHERTFDIQGLQMSIRYKHIHVCQKETGLMLSPQNYQSCNIPDGKMHKDCNVPSSAVVEAYQSMEHVKLKKKTGLSCSCLADKAFSVQSCSALCPIWCTMIKWEDFVQFAHAEKKLAQCELKRHLSVCMTNDGWVAVVYLSSFFHYKANVYACALLQEWFGDLYDFTAFAR